MSTAPPSDLSLDAFLAWEDRQDGRYEFDGFQPVAMTGGTFTHNLILANVITALNTRLRGTPCRAVGGQQKIMAANSVRYPDVVVTCAPVPRGSLVVDAPLVVFEVVSPGSQRTDRIVKALEYRDTPAIRRYVILEQDQQAATVFSRHVDGWMAEVVSGAGELPMPELGIGLPLAECYDSVEFDAP